MSRTALGVMNLITTLLWLATAAIHIYLGAWLLVAVNLACAVIFGGIAMSQLLS